VLWQLFGLVTLGFGLPYTWYKQNQFMINNYRFGQISVVTTARASDFYMLFFVLMGMRNSVTVGGYFNVIVVNSVLIVVTLGIFYPWAAARLPRYLQSNLWVEATALDSFVADEADGAKPLEPGFLCPLSTLPQDRRYLG